MRRMLRVVVTAVVGAAALGVMWTPTAAAGCAFPDPTGASVTHSSRSQIGTGEYHPAAFMLTSDHDRRDDDSDGIVGLWHVTFVSRGSQYIPDGTQVDSAYVQWHSDGTEIMNSSRPPSTGSFCMGVWEKTGRNTYRLNHVAISWNPDGTPEGPASIREEVTLDHSGNTYKGTFTIIQYDLSGINVVIPTPIVGELTAERITAH
jgi:hypothetical protein